MTKIIAVAGKGGTGKTTFAALLIKELGKKGKVLAIDADPNFNLNELLGVKVTSTIGKLSEETFKDIPNGFSKQEFIKMELEKMLVETKDFDLIAMGRPEGPGCYCYPNNIIRDYMDILEKNYDFVVIDNEAGLEHLSRRTTRKADYVFIVSDSSFSSILTANRIKELIDEVKIKVGKIFFVLNKGTVISNEVNKFLTKEKIELTFVLPYDENVDRLEKEGRPLLELSDDSDMIKAVRNISEKV